MGYALSGRPTREHKRRKHVPRYHHIVVKRKTSNKNKQKRAKSLNEVSRETSLQAPANFQDLPVEVIQRIFIFSGNTESLPYLNRYFHHHLKPSISLLYGLLWEKFTHKYELADNIACGSNDVALIDTIFDNRLFFEFLAGNHCNILSNILVIIPQSLARKDLDSSDTNQVIQLIRGKRFNDFPEVFYREFNLYFERPDFVTALHDFCRLERPYVLLKDLIHWYVNQQKFSARLSNFFDVVSLILTVADVEEQEMDSVVPLQALISELFSERPNENQINDNESSLRYQKERSMELLTMFLKKFYTGDNASIHLSEAILWEDLRRISNMPLIDLIVKYGGEPQYDIFF